MVTPDTLLYSSIVLLVGLIVIFAIYAAKRILSSKTKGVSKAVVKALYAPLMVCTGLITAYNIVYQLYFMSIFRSSTGIYRQLE